jgi:hypothetical protein
MGSEPIDSEIPYEYEDLYLDVQEALGIYSKLRDEWDGMNGIYLGKSYIGLTDIFEMLEVPKEDWRTIYDLIGIIDKHRSKIIRKNRPSK